tara:strand:+ start:441 stop:644 length:204 start_codon:yes stop_codon:yes gene_type:complete
MKASSLGFSQTNTIKKRESHIDVEEINTEIIKTPFINSKCIVACTLTTFLVGVTLVLGVWYLYANNA